VKNDKGEEVELILEEDDKDEKDSKYEPPAEIMIENMAIDD